MSALSRYVDARKRRIGIWSRQQLAFSNNWRFFYDV
jgi:hypothetical protein